GEEVDREAVRYVQRLTGERNRVDATGWGRRGGRVFPHGCRAAGQNHRCEHEESIHGYFPPDCVATPPLPGRSLLALRGGGVHPFHGVGARWHPVAALDRLFRCPLDL